MNLTLLYIDGMEGPIKIPMEYERVRGLWLEELTIDWIDTTTGAKHSVATDYIVSIEEWKA